MSENYSPSGNTAQRTDTLRVLEVKILNALNASSGGGTEAGAVSQGHGDPVAVPTNPSSAALYTNLDSGVIWTWNVGSQTWF